jgi:hypothetical protein
MIASMRSPSAATAQTPRPAAPASERAAHLVLRDAALQPAPAVAALCAPALA